MSELKYSINFDKLANFVKGSKFVARKRSNSNYKNFDSKIRNMQSKRDAVRYCAMFLNPLDPSQRAVPLYCLLDAVQIDPVMTQEQSERILASVAKTYRQYLKLFIAEIEGQ